MTIKWSFKNGKYNSYIHIQDLVGYKMHAAICFILGFVALNGIIEGHISRFELEIIFVSFAVIVPTLFSLLMPGKLGLVVLCLKPEFWLQIFMFVFFSHLIRIEIITLCVLMNVWGLLVYYFHTRKKLVVPYSYETLRKDAFEAGEEQKRMDMWDKLAGHKS